MGWSVRDYYECSPYEFYCACEGYFHKMDEQQEIQRFAAFRIHQSLVQKPVPLQQFWPLRSDIDSGPNRIEMTQEMKDLIIKSNGLDPEKYK